MQIFVKLKNKKPVNLPKPVDCIKRKGKLMRPLDTEYVIFTKPFVFPLRN